MVSDATVPWLELIVQTELVPPIPPQFAVQLTSVGEPVMWPPPPVKLSESTAPGSSAPVAIPLTVSVVPEIEAVNRLPVRLAKFQLSVPALVTPDEAQKTVDEQNVANDPVPRPIVWLCVVPPHANMPMPAPSRVQFDTVTG